jgi:hypothetical protein
MTLPTYSFNLVKMFKVLTTDGTEFAEPLTDWHPDREQASCVPTTIKRHDLRFYQASFEIRSCSHEMEEPDDSYCIQEDYYPRELSRKYNFDTGATAKIGTVVSYTRDDAYICIAKPHGHVTKIDTQEFLKDVEQPIIEAIIRFKRDHFGKKMNYFVISAQFSYTDK